MKREREDKDDSSAPIVEKEKRVLFGIEHPYTSFVGGQHNSTSHSNNDSLTSESSNISNNTNGTNNDSTVTEIEDVDNKSFGLLSTQNNNTLYQDKEHHETQCDFFQKLSDRINENERCGLEDEDDSDPRQGTLHREEEDCGGIRFFSSESMLSSPTGSLGTASVLSDESTDLSQGVESPAKLEVNPHAEDSPPVEKSVVESNMSTVPETLKSLHVRSSDVCALTKGEGDYNSKQFTSSAYDPNADFWVKQPDPQSSNTLSSNPSVNTFESNKAYTDLLDFKNRPKDLKQTESNATESIEINVPPSSNRLRARKVSFLQDQAWLEGGVHSRTHIKLQRAKSSDNVLSDTLAMGNRHQSVTLDIEETAKLSKDEDTKTISSSSPDISFKKPNSYFKKLRALVMSKSSKSLAELMNFSSEDVSKTNLRRRKGSKIKGEMSGTAEDGRTSSESSTDSISDDITTSNAKQLLHTLDKLRNQITAAGVELSPAEDEDVTDRDVNDKDQNALTSSNSSHHYIDKPVSSNDIRKDLLAVSLDSAGPCFPSYEDLKARVRTHSCVSETNYSLLRPDNDERHPDGHTVTFTRIPSIRRNHFQARLRHHLHVTFDSDSDVDDLHTLKDATHVNPLETGEVIVTDILSNKLIVFDADGQPKVTFAVEPGSEPWATCLTPGGDLAVTLKRQGCVSMWSPSGEPISEFGEEYLSAPSGIQCDGQGRFLVTDEDADAVFVFNSKGKILTQLRTESKPGTNPSQARPFSKPRYVTLTADGNYVISDSANHHVKIFDSSLTFVRQFGGCGRRDGQFKFPYGVASDELGNLFVADHFNNRVSLFSKDGDFLEHLLTPQDQITRPKGLAVKNGLMYVTYGDLRANKVAVFKIKSV